MRQLLQSFKTGNTTLSEIPAPQVTTGQVLIKTSRSLVSLGTERMLVEFGKANLIQKARQQPDKVKMVLDKIKADGLMPTLETVFNKLEQPLPLGYCNVGRVIAVGKGVSDFKIGDRVASNGPHAEIVCVHQNLVAHIPEGVSDEEATFTVIGAIGLQGIRLLQPTFGESVVVFGLGLIGLISAQLLQANGCRVIGIDLDQSKLDLAQKYGITTINPAAEEDPVKAVQTITIVGADGVLITASAKTDSIVSQAAQMSRKRGRIVLVGVVGLKINRGDFYEKELSFQVSCSYGPGRYDDNYEQKGQDYPIGFVRWTEKRNFEAILEALRVGQLKVDPLITEIVPLDNYQQIYGNMGKSNAIASILSYPQEGNQESLVKISTRTFIGSKAILGIVGAGNFTKMTLLPALKGANIKYIASAGGVNSTALAQKYNIENSTTDRQVILKDEEVDTLLITTRHNAHASIVVEGLMAGKHVFVEKPLCLNRKELEEISKAYNNSNCQLMVGFNRRFSPYVQRMKELLPNQSPKNIITTMNAGNVPKDVWIHDIEVGGGRIIGEAVHYMDLISYLSGSQIDSVCMNAIGKNPAMNTDNGSILLRMKNGDQGVINYFSNGHKSYSKERVEVYCEDKTLIMDNFRTLKGYGYKGFSKKKGKQDKGHTAQFRAFINRIEEGGDSLIPFESLINTTSASFAALESLQRKEWIDL
jgi:predicted dehydrogenase/threonine dehydrogenase-like Zn-dependent dehydrogenase